MIDIRVNVWFGGGSGRVMSREIVEFIAPQQFSEFFRELFTQAPVNYWIYTTVEEVHNLRKAE